MSRPAFSTKTENEKEAAAREGRVSTFRDSESVENGDTSSTILERDVDNPYRIESINAVTNTGVPLNEFRVTLWIGNDSVDTPLEENALVYRQAHLSNMPISFVPSIEVPETNWFQISASWLEGGDGSDGDTTPVSVEVTERIQ